MDVVIRIVTFIYKELKNLEKKIGRSFAFGGADDNVFWLWISFA